VHAAAVSGIARARETKNYRPRLSGKAIRDALENAT